MEAATAPDRIVEAMRESVASLGFAGSTFDHVARRAGVSRGLLHYHFGTKERLLLEAVRRESELRLEALRTGVAAAGDADEVLAALIESLEQILGSAPSGAAMYFELLTLAPRNPEIAAELAEFGRRLRGHLAEVLRAEASRGVLPADADPEATATFLLALADGIVVRRLSEPELDITPLLARASAAARALLG